jgi:hypothetical protein
VLLAGYFVEITIKPQIFHASVGKIQLSRFCFPARNFQRIIKKITCMIKRIEPEITNFFHVVGVAYGSLSALFFT